MGKTVSTLYNSHHLLLDWSNWTRDALTPQQLQRKKLRIWAPGSTRVLLETETCPVPLTCLSMDATTRSRSSFRTLSQLVVLLVLVLHATASNVLSPPAFGAIRWDAWDGKTASGFA